VVGTKLSINWKTCLDGTDTSGRQAVNLCLVRIVVVVAVIVIVLFVVMARVAFKNKAERIQLEIYRCMTQYRTGNTEGIARRNTHRLYS
jgi:hypothetical protein